jgi:hypothetical protein
MRPGNMRVQPAHTTETTCSAAPEFFVICREEPRGSATRDNQTARPRQQRYTYGVQAVMTVALRAP